MPKTFVFGKHYIKDFANSFLCPLCGREGLDFTLPQFGFVGADVHGSPISLYYETISCCALYGRHKHYGKGALLRLKISLSRRKPPASVPGRRRRRPLRSWARKENSHSRKRNSFAKCVFVVLTNGVSVGEDALGLPCTNLRNFRFRGMKDNSFLPKTVVFGNGFS